MNQDSNHNSSAVGNVGDIVNFPTPVQKSLPPSCKATSHAITLTHATPTPTRIPASWHKHHNLHQVKTERNDDMHFLYNWKRQTLRQRLIQFSPLHYLLTRWRICQPWNPLSVCVCMYQVSYGLVGSRNSTQYERKMNICPRRKWGKTWVKAGRTLGISIVCMRK